MKNEIKFTDTLWMVADGDDSVVAGAHGEGGVIADGITNPHDAYLVAAAPDLYRACVKALTRHDKAIAAARADGNWIAANFGDDEAEDLRKAIARVHWIEANRAAVSKATRTE